MAPTKSASRLLHGVVVAIAGDLGPGWSPADVARWTAYHGGRFAAAVSRGNEEGVTHLLCTRDEYSKAPARRDASLQTLAACAGVHVVLRDWLEDSLHARRRCAERSYLLRSVLQRAAQPADADARQKRLAALRARGRREGETFVDRSLYRVYRDATGFAYQVTLLRDHPEAGVVGERYVLHLFESLAQPPLYWFAARHYKSRTHTQPRSFRPSATCQLLATEFAHFAAFFRKKTGVAWDARLVGTPPARARRSADLPPAYFTYQRPTGGKPVGVMEDARNLPREEEAHEQGEEGT